ncbi:late embryogenesis abundant protein At1g64065-like [Cannabis sativa]|uniref:late embryogenesis abundant protein At1g64065-like n=1 Tax=Cannabis sativa TaxID=3483 RepID=UPI0029CA02B0|nr:late embryogenesis abundant protein At1g64065-like [Cannabis sativa]
MSSNNNNAQQVHPAQNDDVETATMESNSKEVHHKKSMKRLCYVALLVLLLSMVVLLFTTTIFHVHTPKFLIRSMTIDELSTKSSKNNAIVMKFEAEIGIKNTNFGKFEFEKASVGFFYRGAHVALVEGDGFVGEGKVKARSTKKIQFTGEIRTRNNSILVDDNDIISGFLTLTGKAKLSGTVHLLKLIKRKRSSEMNCTVTINLYEKVVQDINCK